MVWPKVFYEVKVNLGADGLTWKNSGCKVQCKAMLMLLVWFCLSVLVKSPAIGPDIEVGSVWHRGCLV